MVRIAGVNIPNHEHTIVGLTAVYGIDRSRARKICETTGTPTDKRVKDLTGPGQGALRKEIEKFLIEGDLRRKTAMNIKRLMGLGCYRGIRHRKGLLIHGQHTRTNACTRKGPHKAGVALKE